MALHAVDDLGDAIEATKLFLMPPVLGRWLRLAVVVFFAGGVGVNLPLGGGSSPPTTRPDTGMPGQPEQFPGALPVDPFVVAAAVAGLALLLWLVFGVLGAVMEFVLVDSLREESVRIRRYVRRHWRRGLRLFAFRIGLTLLGLLVVGAVGALAATAFVGGPLGSWGPPEIAGLLTVLLPVLAVVFGIVALVDGFTTAFVVPVMLMEGRTVLGGWRRFFPTLRSQPKQYGAYVVLAFVLTLAIGVLSATAVGIGALVLAIPFAVLAGVVVAVGSVTLSPLWIAVGVAFALVYVLLVATLFALVQVPLRTFMRYYTLFILGDTDEAFDLIPDARRAVRT